MSEEELRGRLEDLHKRLEKLQSRPYTGEGTSFMIFMMFAFFLLRGCSL